MTYKSLLEVGFLDTDLKNLWKTNHSFSSLSFLLDTARLIPQLRIRPLKKSRLVIRNQNSIKIFSFRHLFCCWSSYNFSRCLCRNHCENCGKAAADPAAAKSNVHETSIWVHFKLTSTEFAFVNIIEEFGFVSRCDITSKKLQSMQSPAL